VSHSVWSRVPDPGGQPVPEVIGVDLWMDAERMNAYYDLGLGFDALGPVFAGAPDTSVWRSAPVGRVVAGPRRRGTKRAARGRKPAARRQQQQHSAPRPVQRESPAPGILG